MFIYTFHPRTINTNWKMNKDMNNYCVTKLMVIFTNFFLSIITYEVRHSTMLVFYNKMSPWTLLHEFNFGDDFIWTENFVFLYYFTVVMISINYLLNIYQKVECLLFYFATVVGWIGLLCIYYLRCCLYYECFTDFIISKCWSIFHIIYSSNVTISIFGNRLQSRQLTL